MALVNVAWDLVKRGKRVLLVDFDLEAPGLPSFDLFDASTAAGLVDYVTEYLTTNQAPDVQDFVIQSGKSDRLWIMPAGRGDAGYGARLAAIDWQDLYAHRDGYLMFEDLRAQWQQAFTPDYVLIDSRTGHNDTGGICTRHLPDAMVGLFFPNLQNIEGMAAVARAVRDEESKGGRSITTLFVPARVPDLDDDEEKLCAMLRSAEEKIGYKEAATIIHQYDSLDLLEQDIFVKTRPRSRLAKEYNELSDLIISGNIADPEGALKYISVLREDICSGKDGVDLDLRRLRLKEIASLQSGNAQILEAIADIRATDMDYDAAASMLTEAIELGHPSSTTLRKRTLSLWNIGRREEGERDLLQIINMNTPEIQDLQFAVRMMAMRSPDLIRDPVMNKIRSLPVDYLPSLASSLTANQGLLDIAQEAIEIFLRASPGEKARSGSRNELFLILIGQKKYQEAMVELDNAPSEHRDISWCFNRAMALWGLGGEPDQGAFLQVVSRHKPKARHDANYSLCLAIAFSVVGSKDQALQQVSSSLSAIKKMPAPTFSPWRYLTVPAKDFADDCNSVRGQIESGQKLTPLLMS